MRLALPFTALPVLAAAAAAADTTITLPVGHWSTLILNAPAPLLVEWAVSMVLLVVACAARRLPAELTNSLRQGRFEKLAPAVAATAAPAPAVSQKVGLSLGDEGEAVKQLQRNLAAINIDPGPIDGKFGSQTQRAVLVFQDRYVPRARGVVDPVTAGALVQAVAERS